MLINIFDISKYGQCLNLPCYHNWKVYIKKNNVRDINYFTKKFTNCWCGQWLLVNEKVILIMSLDEN